MKTVEKRFLTAVAEKNTDTALQALNMCFSEFDKSAKLGIIHANQANRKKARLSAKMMALGQPQVVAAAPAATPTTA